MQQHKRRPMRRLFLVLVFCVAPAVAVAQATDAPQAETHSMNERVESKRVVPEYLPRGAFAGVYLNNGALTPEVRVQWQATLLQAHNDSLVAIFEGGGGYSVSFPSHVEGANSAMTFFYQHMLMVGLGYDAVYRNDFCWGFQVLTGPLFYGAHFNSDPPEHAINGIVEGRGQLGIRAGDFRLMFSAGWGQIYQLPRHSLAAQYTGGPIFGIYLDWRPIVQAR